MRARLQHGAGPAEVLEQGLLASLDEDQTGGQQQDRLNRFSTEL